MIRAGCRTSAKLIQTNIILIHRASSTTEMPPSEEHKSLPPKSKSQPFPEAPDPLSCCGTGMCKGDP